MLDLKLYDRILAINQDLEDCHRNMVMVMFSIAVVLEWV